MKQLIARVFRSSGGGLGRRVLAILLPLAILVVHVAPEQSGAALGPVISLTPGEVTTNGYVGNVFEPMLSFRGEAATFIDREVYESAFIQLDVGGPDPMFQTLGAAVSGDGCAVLRSQPRSGPVTAVILEWAVVNRCRGTATSLGAVGSSYDRDNSVALSFDGRFAAVQVDPFVVQLQSAGGSVIRRYDAQTQTAVDMVVPAPYDGTVAEYGLDISDNGRFVTVPVRDVSDNRIEVAVWDAQTGAVTIVDDAGPTFGFSTWSAYPSISGDGQWVSFSSNRARGLGEDPARGPWVYVTNRTSGATRIISAVTAASYYSSLSRDGSQVAYSVADPPLIIILPTFTITIPIFTLPPPTPPPIGFAPGPRGSTPGECEYRFEPISRIETECPPTRVNVAYSRTPGLTGSIQVETVSFDASNRRVGNHWEPALSGNGRWVSWVSNVGDDLLGTEAGLNGSRHAFTRRRDPGLSVSPVDFGTVDVNSDTVRQAFVRNTGRTSVSIDSIVPPASPFTTAGGTCSTGDILPPGENCTIRIRFRPNGVVDSWNSTVRVEENGYDAIGATGRVLGSSTTGPTIPPPETTLPEQSAGSPILTASPDPADFGTIDVGLASAVQTITVTNIGDGAGLVGTTLDGPHPDDFFVQTNNCVAITLLPGDSCTMDVIFIPGGNGGRSATLTASTPLSSVDIELSGQGVAVVELVANPAEVDYGPVNVGFSTPDETITITNVGNAAGVLNTTLDGPHPGDFFVRVNNCVNTELQPGQSCTLDIAMFPRAGGNRNATLSVTSGTAGVDVPLRGQGRFEPELMASPEAVTERAITILIGQGFPAGENVTIEIRPHDGEGDIANITTIDVTADEEGRFREPFGPLGILDVGPYTLHIDRRANVYERIDEPLVVALPTFQPQGPTGPAFNNNLLVARG